MTRIATLTAFGIVLSLGACADLPASPVATSVTRSSSMVAGPGAGITNPDDDPNVPGATGRMIIPGDNSTIAGDSVATMMQRTGRV